MQHSRKCKQNIKRKQRIEVVIIFQTKMRSATTWLMLLVNSDFLSDRNRLRQVLASLQTYFRKYVFVRTGNTHWLPSCPLFVHPWGTKFGLGFINDCGARFCKLLQTFCESPSKALKKKVLASSDIWFQKTKYIVKWKKKMEMSHANSSSRIKRFKNSFKQ